MIPFVIASSSQETLSQQIASNRQTIDNTIRELGAVLLRGFNISTEPQFQEIVTLLCGQPLNYMYRSTPRTDLGHGIYTATEYPAGLSIPLHNENAYQRDWPLLIMFCCIEPAADKAGQTPIADTIRVTNRIPKMIQDVFREKEIMYIRNYHQSVDLPWQVVFQTQSRDMVDKYCEEHEIETVWFPDGALQTRQICQAFANHPVSESCIWFNQAHLFHPSALDGRTRAALGEMFTEDRFPRNATFGDGSRIDEEMLAEIRTAFEAEKVLFEWRKGDVLVLDNMRVSHGRTPFKGKRRILTAMGRPYSAYIK